MNKFFQKALIAIVALASLSSLAIARDFETFTVANTDEMIPDCDIVSGTVTSK